MSYCRKNGVDSDVYVIGTKLGWECLAYPNPENGPSVIGVPMRVCGFSLTREGMLKHLLNHRAEGDKVPQSALDRLREEIAAE